MEQGPTNNNHKEDARERLLALEQAYAALEQRAQKYENEWSAQYDRNKELREENLRLQHDYETLRIQKGGFGFKMLMLSGFSGFVIALILCFVYLKLRPKEQHVVAFRQFQRENLINFELAISKGQFGEVEQTLERSLERPEYQPIEHQIVFMKEMMEATRKRCGQ